MKRETKEWLILSVLVIMFLLAGVIAFSQDSVILKVVRSEKINDSTIRYTFKIKETGEKVISFCVCKEFRKKGELVLIHRKDLKFIE